MKINTLPDEYSIVKYDQPIETSILGLPFFYSASADEFSLVCKTRDVPYGYKEKEDHWKGFYLDGILDFSLIGILSPILNLMASRQIPVFVVSTFNTDYVFVKDQYFSTALQDLQDAGYTISDITLSLL